MSQTTIRSPLPGTFYRRPAPDQPVFKEAGDTVSEGETIGLIEVMKSFHEIPSKVSGTITAFNVENEDAVTAGQDLATVETG